VSEFVATLVFIFIGTGSVVASQEQLGEEITSASLVLIALAHGFAIMVLVYSIGEISGGHINPAVTWATLLTSKISIVRALVYWASQITGGIVGSALLFSVLPETLRHSMGCHALNPALTPAQGFGVELVFTFIFIFVVFATAISPFAGKLAPLSGNDYGPGKLTPFAVGMTIMILHTVGIPLTGASMNPARTFGPAVVTGCWDNHWIYWVGPLVGSTTAALIAQIVFLANPNSIQSVFKITRGQGEGSEYKNNTEEETTPD
jgi:MIP family channel proteins